MRMKRLIRSFVVAIKQFRTSSLFYIRQTSLTMATQLPLNKTVSARPPDKGSFPIDHLSECKQTMIDYLKCLKDSKFQGDKCRELSKQYLKCRMDNNLMAKEEWKYLGFKDDSSEATMPTGLNTTHGQSSP